MISHADELEREIADEQEALGENLAELEHQAKELVDWRAQVRKNPRTMLGLAFGGGVLLAVLAGAGGGRSGARMRRGREPAAEGDDHPSEASETWEMLKGALVAAAASEVTSYVVELLPDFREHLAAQHRTTSSRAPRARRPRPGVATNGDAEGPAEF